MDMNMNIQGRFFPLFIGMLIILAIIVLVGMFLLRNPSNSTPMPQRDTLPEETRTALFAGGCFWCVEADFEKLRGIVNVVSGYAGGATGNPDHYNYSRPPPPPSRRRAFFAAAAARRPRLFRRHRIRKKSPRRQLSRR